MKILTVDDSLTIRKIIGSVISMLGYEACEADSGAASLEILLHGSDDIALVLLDWNMPGMSGFEVLEIIKSNEKLRHIPVMMVTTEGENGNIRHLEISHERTIATYRHCAPTAIPRRSKRIPLATAAGLESKGIRFLLIVMLTGPNIAVASLPVMFLALKSTKNK